MLKLMKLKKKRRSAINDQPNIGDVMTKHTIRVQDLFAPDGLEILFDRLRLGASQHTRVYALHGLPRRVAVGWLDDIYRAGDIDLAVHIVPAPDRDVIATLVKRETQARSQEYLDRQAGNISRLPELEAQIADYRALRDAVQLGQDRLFFVTLLVAVHAPSAEELARRCDIVESTLARIGARPVALVLRQLDGLKATLPLNHVRGVDDFARNLTSGAATCCLPLTVSTGGHSTGVMLGTNLYTGNPVFLDRFAGEAVIANQHIFISGQPGSGKSVALRLLSLLEGYLHTRTAFVDPEGEYVEFTRRLGGQVVTLEPGVFSGMNPLDVEPETLEDGTRRVSLLEKATDLQGLVGAVFRYHSGEGLDVRETALLEEAVREEYAARGITADPESLYAGGIKKPMPTLSDVQRRVAAKPGAERLADAMKPLLAGGSLGMFDGQTTLTLKDAPFICFNLRRLESDFARFVGVYVTLAWLWQHFAQVGGRDVKKSVAVDEAWMFLRHPDAANYLETLARRGRKHGCALTVATQRFEEFSSSPEGRAVIESCASILVLKQEDHAARAAVEYFKLADGCWKIIHEANPGQGILRTSGMTVAVQVQPAPFEWELVDTKVRGR
jgi:type IV secretory pathway VirB4 component